MKLCAVLVGLCCLALAPAGTQASSVKERVKRDGGVITAGKGEGERETKLGGATKKGEGEKERTREVEGKRETEARY